MAVELRPITRENLGQCIGLTVAEDQQGFVASNAVSVAQAYVEPTWVPLAIYDDQELVGFVMYGREPETGRDWIIRLMVAAEQQGKGYGRAAMEAAIERLRQQPDCTAIYISYVPQNTRAGELYRRLGFEPTGEIDDGEVVARLTLRQPSDRAAAIERTL